MDILKDSKLLLVSLFIILLAEAIGQIKISLVMVFPMLYSMLMGGIISFPKFKILNEKNMAHATSIMSVALVILIAKLSTSVGASGKNHSGRWCAGSAGSGPLYRYHYAGSAAGDYVRYGP